MVTRGTYCKPLSNLRKNFFAACLLRRLCTRMSRSCHLYRQRAISTGGVMSAASPEVSLVCERASQRSYVEGFNQRVMVCAWDDSERPPAAAEAPLLEE